MAAAEQPVRERRDQLSHPHYAKPEFLATAPNQVWSWDITRLLGPQCWTCFHLYALLDIFSRYVVGWMLAERENVALAARLIEESCLKQAIQPQVLTPSDVHDGRAEGILEQRHRTLKDAWAQTPERFVHGPPKLQTLPDKVWINPPDEKETTQVLTKS